MILDQADHVRVTDAFALGCYAMWFDTDEDVWVFNNIFKVAIYFSFVKTNDILIKSWRGKNCKQTLAEAGIEIIS